MNVRMLPCDGKDLHPLQGVFPPHIQWSWDKPDQEKAITQDE